MTDLVIRAEALGKHYRLGRTVGRRDTLRDALADGTRTALRALSSPRRHLAERRAARAGIWALRDISFEIHRGEAVGVIGGNGAGKSTLLRILSRITDPTAGRVGVRGRVGSLLEVGTGFHAELTGRENIYLSGAILGMPAREITRRFDEIIEFAGVERFIDTPVKHFSSGMYLRLAFSVAAHLEPDILIVDEVLAVGDAAFQRKCLGRMDDVTRSGRTVLFVSHSMPAVQALCERVLWIRDGHLVENGPTSSVVPAYLHGSAASVPEREWPDREGAPGTDRVRFRSARIHRLGGSPSDPIDVRTPFAVEFEYWNLEAGARLSLAMRVHDERGTLLFDAGPTAEPSPLEPGLYRDVCRIPGDLLNDGVHTFEVRVLRDLESVVYAHPEILAVRIHDSPELRGGWWGRWPGAIRPHLEWTSERAPEAGYPAQARPS